MFVEPIQLDKLGCCVGIFPGTEASEGWIKGVSIVAALPLEDHFLYNLNSLQFLNVTSISNALQTVELKLLLNNVLIFIFRLLELLLSFKPNLSLKPLSQLCPELHH